MLPWKTMISIDRSHERAVYLQIAEGVIRAISQGVLKAGHRLPGSRKLAESLGINRKTAEVAYDELMAQGWVEIHPSRGVFVVDHLPFTSFLPIGKDPATVSNEEGVGYDFPFSAIIPPYQAPVASRIFISEGTPDVRLAPMEQLIN